MTATDTRIAWFNCFAGIAGDMALGSLIDAGAELGAVRELLGRLPITGWSLEAEPVLRGGIAATRALVTVREDGVARTLPVVRSLLVEASLPDRVHRRSLATFERLAEVEARLHRRDPDEVHFHELGAHDTLVDVVGTAAALEDLDVEEVVAGPIATGTGTIHCAHGELPNPGPAVLALLEGAPMRGRAIDVELVTPTGAALLAAMASGFGPLPAVRLLATGYGAGARELEGLPNCTAVVLGTREVEGESLDGQPLVELEANLDDATGEQLADTLEALLAAGARDAWVTPVLMKKGRPGHLVSLLADPEAVGRLRAVLVGESGTLGVRAHGVERWAAARTTAEVEVEGHRIRLKVTAGRVKVEHDDAARAARLLGIPVREVAGRAEAAWRSGT